MQLMSIVTLLLWMLEGAAVGFVLTKLTDDSAIFSLLNAIALCVLGAFTGGLLSSLVFNFTLQEFQMIGVIAALIGAVITAAVQYFFLSDNHLSSGMQEVRRQA